MALLGGAWTTNVIWQLSGGPRRFGELYRDMAGISPKMLTARLRNLEEKRVVIRKVVPSSPPSVEYALSELGKELLPVIDTIVRVGTRLLRDEGRDPVQRVTSEP
jgi:DNA-binding HxlR family transcriptional regulator